MPTEITQSEIENGGRTVFRVSGEMLIDDAVLVDKIVRETIGDNGDVVSLDLADLNYMDSDAAAVLKRLQDEKHVRIEGIEIFLQSAIDSAERTGDR